MSSKLAGLNQGFPLSPLKWRPMVPREITHLGRKPKQRLDVRKTVACTQADNSQVTTLFMHASNNSRCFQLSRRAAAFCSGTTGAGRHNAAASKSARTPSLRLLQPRVPPASACRGRRTRTTLLKRLRPRHSPRRRQFDRRHNGSTAENAAAGRGNPGAH